MALHMHLRRESLVVRQVLFCQNHGKVEVRVIGWVVIDGCVCMYAAL
jgi:hypothetical protein